MISCYPLIYSLVSHCFDLIICECWIELLYLIDDSMYSIFPRENTMSEQESERNSWNKILYYFFLLDNHMTIHRFEQCSDIFFANIVSFHPFLEYLFLFFCRISDTYIIANSIKIDCSQIGSIAKMLIEESTSCISTTHQITKSIIILIHE